MFHFVLFREYKDNEKKLFLFFFLILLIVLFRSVFYLLFFSFLMNKHLYCISDTPLFKLCKFFY
nr:MAG TPA: hypothetical protein [Caudoviricetes sp.]